MITRGIKAYVSRDWGAARAAKDEYWAARIARLGPGEGLRIAETLRQQVVHQTSGWPSETDRDDDLRAHARLAELLRRASPATRG